MWLNWNQETLKWFFEPLYTYLDDIQSITCNEPMKIIFLNNFSMNMDNKGHIYARQSYFLSSLIMLDYYDFYTKGFLRDRELRPDTSRTWLQTQRVSGGLGWGPNKRLRIHILWGAVLEPWLSPTISFFVSVFLIWTLLLYAWTNLAYLLLCP